MYGINYVLIVYMLVLLISRMFKYRIDKISSNLGVTL